MPASIAGCADDPARATTRRRGSCSIAPKARRRREVPSELHGNRVLPRRASDPHERARATVTLSRRKMTSLAVDTAREAQRSARCDQSILRDERLGAFPEQRASFPANTRDVFGRARSAALPMFISRGASSAHDLRGAAPMIVETSTRCAHASCTCHAQEGEQYCSESCRKAAEGKKHTSASGQCACGHASCAATEYASGASTSGASARSSRASGRSH